MPPVALVVFARAPEPGRVKTRLIPALGARGACALHAMLVQRTVRLAAGAGVGPVQLACTPHTRAPLFEALARECRVTLCAQAGRDLGARMHAAIVSALALPGVCAAIVVGSDVPLLETGDIRAAAAWLATGVPAAIGPAMDGGYYLVGLREPLPELFDAMPWGTGTVCERTRLRLSGFGSSWRETSLRADLDRPEDLPLAAAAGLELPCDLGSQNIGLRDLSKVAAKS